MGRRGDIALGALAVTVGGFWLASTVSSQQQTVPVYVADQAPVLGSVCGAVKRIVETATQPSVTYCCAGGLLNPKWTNCTPGQFDGSYVSNLSATTNGGLSITGPNTDVEASIISCPNSQILRALDGGWVCESETAETDPLSIHVGVTPLCAPGQFMRNNDAGFVCAPLGTPVCADGYVLKNNDAGFSCVRGMGGLPLCGTDTALKNNDAGVACITVVTVETDPLSMHVGSLPLCADGTLLKNTDAGPSCVTAVLTEVDPTAVHLTGDESIAGTKDFTEGKTTWTGTASDTTGGELTGGPAKNISTAGRVMIFRGGPGAYDGYNTPTAGGVTYFYGGVGGHGDKSHTGATGGVAYVAGGFGGNGTSETLPGAGADLYVSGGPPGSATASGNVNGSSLHLNPGAPYNSGTNGTVYIGDAYSPTSIELRGPTVIGGGGTAISLSKRGTTTWDMPSTGLGACASTTITVTGAAVGADVILGLPSGWSSTVLCNGVVSSSNTVTLLCCCTGTSTCNPSSATFAARVLNP